MAKQFSRPMVVLLIIQFLVMVGFGIIIPILPFLIEKLGGGPAMLGVFMSAYSVMQFFFAPMWGRLSDRIGRRPVILIGLSGYGVTFIMFGLVDQVWLLVGIRALAGMVSSATLPTAMAYIADITEEHDRSKSMGMIGAAMGLGMVFGPALGGWLGHYSISLPFFAAGGLAFLVLPFAWALLPESLQQAGKTNLLRVSRFNSKLFKDPLFFLFLFYFVSFLVMAMFEGTFSLLAKDTAGFGPKQMGSVFAIFGIIGVIVQGGLIGKLVKTFGDAKVAKYGAWVSGFGFILIVLASNRVSLVLATAVFMIGNSVMGPTCSSLATKYATAGKGASLGLLHSFGSLGRILGPVIGGLLYGVNMRLPYLVGAGILLFTVFTGNRKLARYEKIGVDIDAA